MSGEVRRNPYSMLPDLAWEVCQTQDEKGFVWDLFKNARHRRYAPLKRQSLRAMALKAHLSKERVQRLLTDLADEGLITAEIEWAGKRSRGMTIRVIDPLTQSQYRHAPRHQGDITRDIGDQEEAEQSDGSATCTATSPRHAPRHQPSESKGPTPVPPEPQNPDPRTLNPEEEEEGVFADASTTHPPQADEEATENVITVDFTDGGQRRKTTEAAEEVPETTSPDASNTAPATVPPQPFDEIHHAGLYSDGSAVEETTAARGLDAATMRAAAAPKRKTKAAQAREDWHVLMKMWAEKIVPYIFEKHGILLPKHEGLSPDRGIGAQVLSCLRTHGLETFKRVLRWYAGVRSVDPDDWSIPEHIKRPSTLRTQRRTLKTLTWKSNFEEYLGFTELWEAEKAAGGASSSGKRAMSEADRRFLEQHKRAKQAHLDRLRNGGAS